MRKISSFFLLLVIVIFIFTLGSCASTPRYDGPPRPEFEPKNYVFGNYIVRVTKIPPEIQTNNLAYFFLTSGQNIIKQIYLHKDQPDDVKVFSEFENMNLSDKRSFIRGIFVKRVNFDVGP